MNPTLEFWSDPPLTPGKVYAIPLANGKNVSGTFVSTRIILGNGSKNYIFEDPPDTFMIWYRPMMGRVSYKEEGADAEPVDGPATDVTLDRQPAEEGPAAAEATEEEEKAALAAPAADPTQEARSNARAYAATYRELDEAFVDSIVRVDEHSLPEAGPEQLGVFGTLVYNPLSGVSQLAILTNGDQKILLIGEWHGTNFCRDKGFTPICQLIETFLQQTPNIEFMIEARSHFLSYDATNKVFLEKVRHITRLKENKRLFIDRPPEHIINLTRFLVQRFIKPPKLSKRPYEVEPLDSNSHVSWLEPELILAPSRNFGDIVIRLFAEFKDAVLSKYPASVFALRCTLSTIFIKYCPVTPGWLQAVVDFGPELGPEGDIELENDKINEIFSKSSEADNRQFVLTCFELLFEANYFQKCVSTKERKVDVSIYVMLFMQGWHDVKTPNLNQFYFFLQRFFVDIFTVCRLLKRNTRSEEDAWFKNVVIYSGEWHTTNVRRILRALGYTEYKLTQFELNPRCSRRFGGSKQKRRTKRTNKTNKTQRRKKKYPSGN